jgi:hypothetical protein
MVAGKHLFSLSFQEVRKARENIDAKRETGEDETN